MEVRVAVLVPSSGGSLGFLCAHHKKINSYQKQEYLEAARVQPMTFAFGRCMWLMDISVEVKVAVNCMGDAWTAAHHHASRLQPRMFKSPPDFELPALRSAAKW